MITPITFPTAFKYWLQASSRPLEECFFADLAGADHSAEALLKDARIFHIEDPIHVLVAKPDHRHVSVLLNAHVLPRNLPPGSFVRLTDSLFIISPECCFLFAANALSLPELVCAANDLCAIYRRDAISALEQSGRPALTNKETMEKYLDRSYNIKGLKSAKQALKYAVDCSNSPMESKLAALFCIPMGMGGFGLPGPSMNPVINLPTNAASFLGRDNCRADMVWYIPKVIVEYDSNLTHLSREQHHYDKKRATALAIAGYTVISVTADHLNSHSSIDKLCLDLRNALGIRTHMDRFNKYGHIRYETVEKIIYGRTGVQNLRL